MRSLETFLVESHHASQTNDIGRLHALISVVEGIGSLAAGPGMAYALGVGIDWGRAWPGLPFALASLLLSPLSIAVFHNQCLVKLSLSAGKGFTKFRS